jgi:hypothetical protein
MIQVKQNKNNTIHGTYRSPELTLKLLIENKPAIGNSLKHKIDAFLEGDNGVLVCPLNAKIPHAILKLDREKDSYQVTLIKKMEIQKENMSDIVSLLEKMASACDEVPSEDPIGSFTNLLDLNKK